MADDTHNFAVLDYLLFAFTLAISACIGFYYAFKERKNQTSENVLLGDRRLKVRLLILSNIFHWDFFDFKIFPVGISIMASFTSAVSILGFSTEMYQHGSMYWLMGFSYFITQPIAAHVFVPFYHRLRITSAYEVTLASAVINTHEKI